jgi:hypothetical protein
MQIVSLALCLIVKFNHTADSIALIVVDTILCGIEHYYPYGGTAIIAGKDKTRVQQKRYRYTGKEKDDRSGLSYYGARYLAPCG